MLHILHKTDYTKKYNYLNVIRKFNFLVDQVECRTNTTYLIDFIQICLRVQSLNLEEIRDFYVKDGLSVSQIADRVGVVKSVILTKLRQIGIDTSVGRTRQTNPNNFRHHNPPYGYKVKDNKLIVNKSELKVCRMVVESMGRKNMGARETAREIVKKEFKNRKGEVAWGHLVVQQIFKRWNGKI